MRRSSRVALAVKQCGRREWPRLLNRYRNSGLSLADAICGERSIHGEHVGSRSCAGICRRGRRRWRHSASATTANDRAENDKSEQESSYDSAIRMPPSGAQQEEANREHSRAGEKRRLPFRQAPILPSQGTGARRRGCGVNGHERRDSACSGNVQCIRGSTAGREVHGSGRRGS